MEQTEQTTIEKTMGFIRRRFAKIDEINRKYATPQIKMTQNVKTALLLLRVYLLLLVVLLAYKFFTMLK
jgi:hypothetical protein